MCDETLVFVAEHDNQRLEIHADHDPENPRELANLGIMVHGHKRYLLGDVEAWNTELYNDWDEWLQGEIIAEHGEDNVVALPLYLFDHSIITMLTRPFSCPWDSGQVGWIYCTKERFLEITAYGEKGFPDRCKEMLESEVEEFDKYIRGDVYGFVYESQDEYESVWGFYGQDFESNGLKDQLPDEAWPLLDQLESVC